MTNREKARQLRNELYKNRHEQPVADMLQFIELRRQELLGTLVYDANDRSVAVTQGRVQELDNLRTMFETKPISMTSEDK